MHLRIGTRASQLALWQASYVADLLKKNRPDIKIEIVPIKTKGDMIINQPLNEIGGKGLFLKEIEEALLREEIDLAIHSMKDVPYEITKGLTIPAILKREDPRDVLISFKGHVFKELPKDSVIGTSSLRRIYQLKAIRSDLSYQAIRGNIDTRLKKLKANKFHALVLAAAGLKRLRLEKEITEYLPIIPSVGQGALGIEIRKKDKIIDKLIKPLNDKVTFECVSVERAFSRHLQGDCQTPLACHAFYEGKKIKIEAFFADVEGEKQVKKSVCVTSQKAIETAEEMAKEMLKKN